MTGAARTARVTLATAGAMEALGAHLAASVPAASVVFLHGALAAGKTTFARGYARALGYRGAIKSPTFTLVECYSGGVRPLHHFDLYRLADGAELEFIGIDDYFDGDADVLVEWPERAGGVLPAPTVSVHIDIRGTLRDALLTCAEELDPQIISDLKNTKFSYS